MHSAPSVSYPVGRSSFWGNCLLACWMVGAGVALVWHLSPQAPAWSWWLADLTVLGSGILAWRLCRHSPVGRVLYRGGLWTLEHRRNGKDAQDVAGQLQVRLDLQKGLLCVWQRPDGRRLWLPLDARADPLRWKDLRRAVYSPGPEPRDTPGVQHASRFL